MASITFRWRSSPADGRSAGVPGARSRAVSGRNARHLHSVSTAHSLDRQHPRLGLPSSVRRKPSRLPAGSQHPMTGNNDWDGVPSQRLSHGSGPGGPAKGPGQVAVGSGIAGRDLSSGVVHSPLKVARSLQVHRDVSKILRLTPKVQAHSPDHLGNRRRGSARNLRACVSCDSRLGNLPGGFGKLHQGHGR